MANKVRISTIGGPYYSVEPGISPAEAVTQMERQLLAGIRCVTPDRPDLIVLPEMCDIPLRYTKEQRSLFLRSEERGYSKRWLHSLGGTAAMWPIRRCGKRGTVAGPTRSG
jgi:hypothetical protein